MRPLRSVGTVLVPSLLVLVVVYLIYKPALGAYFYEDDFQWLASRLGFHPSDLLRFTEKGRFFRPVIDLYFWIGALLGGSVSWFHAASIGLHAVNCGLVYLTAVALGWRKAFAYAGALFFAVQPAHVDGAAWIGALAEPLVVCFGCASLLCLLRHRRTGRALPLIASVALFGLALGSHQSAIVLLPLFVFGDFVAAPAEFRVAASIRRYFPFAVLAGAALLIEFTINSRHQLVESGEYGFGLRTIRHTFDYIASLVAMPHRTGLFVAIAAVLCLVLARGTMRARLAVAWLILTTLPFALFDVPSVSRYAYIPAVGFSWLLADGLDALERRLASSGARLAGAIVALLVVIVAARFGMFAAKNVRIFVLRTQPYETFLTDLRREHPVLPDGTVIPIDAAMDKEMPQRYLEAAVQWEYRNPSLRVTVQK